MKKRCKGVTKDYNIVSRFNLLFILVFFIYPLELLAQVPINGFCRITEMEPTGLFNKLLPVSFNNDAYTDLFLYNTTTGSVASYAGKENLLFQIGYTGKLSTKISATAFNKTNATDELLYVSSLQKKVGVLGLGTSGTPSFYQIKSTDFFPNQVLVSQKNPNSKFSLVNGSGMQGVVAVTAGKQGLTFKTVIKNGIFPLLALGDFNTDSYTDFCAYDIKNTAITIFNNNSRNAFRFSKIIPLNGHINHLASYDLNADGNPEIIYATENSLNLIVGDSVHSYRTIKEVISFQDINNFVFSDFNRDGKIDIAFTSGSAQGLHLLFQKENLSFYPPIAYAETERIVDIAPFYSKFINALAFISDKGAVRFLHHVLAFSESLKLSENSKDCIPFFTDIGNDGIEDFGFIDNGRRALRFYIRNKVGTPGLVYDLPIFYKAEHVEVLDNSKTSKSFFLSAVNARQVQFISADFRDFTVKRKSIDIDGKILSSGKVITNIGTSTAMLIQAENALRLCLLRGDSIYQTKNLGSISTRDSIADIAILKNGDVVLVAAIADTVKWLLFADSKKTPHLLYQIINSKNNYLKTYCYDFFNNGKEQMLIITKNGSKVNSYISYLNGRTIPTQFSNTFMKGFEPGEAKYFGNDGSSGLNKFYITSVDQKLFKAEFSRIKRRIHMSAVPVRDKIQWFAVRKLNSLNYSLIYTSDKRNYIGIEKL